MSHSGIKAFECSGRGVYRRFTFEQRRYPVGYLLAVKGKHGYAGHKQGLPGEDRRCNLFPYGREGLPGFLQFINRFLRPCYFIGQHRQVVGYGGKEYLRAICQRRQLAGNLLNLESQHIESRGIIADIASMDAHRRIQFFDLRVERFDVFKHRLPLRPLTIRGAHIFIHRTHTGKRLGHFVD